MATSIQITDQSGEPIHHGVHQFHLRGGIKMTNSHAAKKSFEQQSLIDRAKQDCIFSPFTHCFLTLRGTNVEMILSLQQFALFALKTFLPVL